MIRFKVYPEVRVSLFVESMRAGGVPEQLGGSAARGELRDGYGISSSSGCCARTKGTPAHQAAAPLSSLWGALRRTELPRASVQNT